MGIRLQRRQFLVDKRFQLSHAAWIGLGQCLSMLLIALAISWFYLFVLDRRMVSSHNPALLWHTGCAVVIIMLLAALWSVFFTHRIAGPTRKLTQFLERAVHGDIPPGGVHFRRRDALKSSEAPLNAFLETYRLVLMRNAEIEALISRNEDGTLPAEEAVLGVRKILSSEKQEGGESCAVK